MWPIFLEFSLSVLWACGAMLFLICMAVLAPVRGACQPPWRSRYSRVAR